MNLIIKGKFFVNPKNNSQFDEILEIFEVVIKSAENPESKSIVSPYWEGDKNDKITDSTLNFHFLQWIFDNYSNEEYHN